MITKHIKVYGRVQGVGFRQGTVRLADKYNVAGTAANVDDYVEIYATGRADDLTPFIEDVLAGPTPFSKVHSYDIQQIDLKHYDGFSQKY